MLAYVDRAAVDDLSDVEAVLEKVGEGGQCGSRPPGPSFRRQVAEASAFDPLH